MPSHQTGKIGPLSSDRTRTKGTIVPEGSISLSHLWVRVYLRSRTLCVKAGTSDSDQVFMLLGIPQGSVLGHIPLAEYFQPMTNIKKHHNLQFHQYKDDTQLCNVLNVNKFNLIQITQECMCDQKILEDKKQNKTSLSLISQKLNFYHPERPLI